MLISVGFFIFLTAVLLIVGLGYVISQKGIFEKKFYYNLVAKSGADLIEGMPVLYSGFEIGAVTRLDLTDEGKVEVVIEIPKHEQRWIRRSSLFYLNKPLIGSAAIVVESPMLNDVALDEKDERQLLTVDGINELIAKVQPVLDDIQGIVNNVNKITDAKSDLAKTLKNVEVITYKISQTKAVNHLDQMMKELRVNIASILEKVDKKILGDNNSSISKVNAMLDDIAMKLKKLDKTVDAVNQSSGQIEGLTQDVKFSMKKTDEILNGVSGLIGSKPEGEVTLP
jgi:phospholipid/cholesterol/gamma-HCH transport system substrate-binding protein